MPLSDRWYYFVQGPEVMFLVEDVKIDKEMFSGRIVMNSAPVAGNKIIIYPSSYKSLEIKETTIRIPLEKISRVETAQASPENKIVLSLGAALVVLFILGSFSGESGMM